MKAVSHGVLVMNPAGELLLCHASGSRHWDIPKGAALAGESSRDAARREAQEECGLVLDAGDLVEVGCFAYLPRKDLCLHAALIERVDLGRCVCTSFFVDPRGHQRPEMDAFRWTPFAEVPQRCARSMAALLERSVSLPAWLARLAAAGPARVAVPGGSLATPTS